MILEEAIIWLRDDIKEIKRDLTNEEISSDYAEEGTKVYEIAISAIKEVQQYREIGTVEECRKAVEKQKAIPVSIGIQNFYKCPKCQTVLRITDKYCHECGQAISWGESKEE